MAGYAPGDEYDLVDRVAGALNLRRWYEWQSEMPTPSTPEGPTNPHLLKEKSPAAVMYLLDALRRFAPLNDAQVSAIASEIALIGRRGLDYASPERQYTVSAFPGERFSGLQLMCLMYAGFRQVDPTVDLGMDFSAEYAAARQLFEGSHKE